MNDDKKENITISSDESETLHKYKPIVRFGNRNKEHTSFWGQPSRAFKENRGWRSIASRFKK